MGGNFLRLILATKELVERFMDPPVLGDAPAGAAQLSADVFNYALKNYKASSDFYSCEAWSSDEEGDVGSSHGNRRAPKKRHEAYTAAWEEFLSVFNGYIWTSYGPRARLGKHFCRTHDCCNGFDASRTRFRAVHAIRNLLWRLLPSTPTKGKWTKLGPACDFS